MRRYVRIRFRIRSVFYTSYWRIATNCAPFLLTCCKIFDTWQICQCSRKEPLKHSEAAEKQHLSRIIISQQQKTKSEFTTLCGRVCIVEMRVRIVCTIQRLLHRTRLTRSSIVRACVSPSDSRKRHYKGYLSHIRVSQQQQQ